MFQNFVGLNAAQCCKQNICTGCLVELKTSLKSVCPFCNDPLFEVKYTETNLDLIIDGSGPDSAGISRSSSSDTTRIVYASRSDRLDIEKEIRSQHVPSAEYYTNDRAARALALATMRTGSRSSSSRQNQANQRLANQRLDTALSGLAGSSSSHSLDRGALTGSTLSTSVSVGSNQNRRGSMQSASSGSGRGRRWANHAERVDDEGEEDANTHQDRDFDNLARLEEMMIMEVYASVCVFGVFIGVTAVLRQAIYNSFPLHDICYMYGLVVSAGNTRIYAGFCN